MAKVFEMDRRARQPIECDDCGDIIEVGEHWVFRRVKERSGWEDYNICVDCAVFGPDHNPMTLPPFAPDYW